MVNLYLQDFGTVCKLFVFADTQQEATYQYNELYNWCATSGDLQNIDELGGKFRYFIWTNKRKLIRYFYNILEHHYFMKTGREPDGVLFKTKLQEQAERRYKNLERREITDRRTRFANLDYYHHSEENKTRPIIYSDGDPGFYSYFVHNA